MSKCVRRIQAAEVRNWLAGWGVVVCLAAGSLSSAAAQMPMVPSENLGTALLVQNQVLKPIRRPILLPKIEGDDEDKPLRRPFPNPRRVLSGGTLPSGKTDGTTDGKRDDRKPAAVTKAAGGVVPVPTSSCTALDDAGLIAETMASISEKGICLVAEPVRYSRLGTRYGVGLSQPAISNCQMARQFVAWLDNAVQAAALEVYEQPVVRVSVAASYVCRTVNSKPDAKVSQHGLGNAIDVSEFVFADGSSVSVLFGWADEGRGQKFLRRIHSEACRYFSTVIGPEGDRWHSDHFHLDLAKHGSRGTHRVCQ